MPVRYLETFYVSVVCLKCLFQDILGTDDTALINKILSETGDYLLTAGPAADPRWGGDDVTLPVTLGGYIPFS